MKNSWKLGILVVVACAAIVGYVLLPRGPALPVLPVPNGYDDLLKAAQSAVSDRHLPYGEASDEELKDLVGRNRAALTLARGGCARECRVTTDYKLTSSVYASQHMPVLAQIKKLALAFRAEGELAEREGKTNDAARIYLDGIRFGQEICRGGLLIDRMVGIACERMNLDPLLRLESDLDAAACHDVARALEQMEGRREPVQATWNEERIWALRVASMQERVGLQIMRLLRPNSVNAARDKSAANLAQIQAQERRLALELGTRADQLEHGKPAP
jgi:hypothetical protein